MSSRPTVIFGLAAMLAIALTGPMVGTVAADNHAPHNVTIETTALTADSTERVQITVTNPQDSDMVSPLVEIPLRNGLTVTDENRSMQSGTEFVDGVSVSNSGSLDESRTAFINESTFRGGTDAVFVEGVVVPANEQRTYTVPLTINGSSEVTLEADVRPLNNEEQNIRISRSIDPTAAGTLDVSVANSDADITISGDGTADQTASGSTVTDVPGNQKYNVSTALSIVDGSVTLTNIQVSEFTTETIEFTDPNPSGTLAPVVVGQTGSQAKVVDGSTVRSTTQGTAESNTTQTVTFDLSVNSGQTIVAVGTQSNLPMDSISSTTGVDNSEFPTNSGGPDVALAETDGAVDDTATVQFEGQLVGDVNNDNNVTADDAATVADSLASGEAGTLTDYADVSDTGEISAVDAMQIQQYAEGNRTADYDDTQGGN